MISVATIQPGCGTVEVAIDNTETNGHGSVPIKLYWQNQASGQIGLLLYFLDFYDSKRW